MRRTSSGERGRAGHGPGGPGVSRVGRRPGWPACASPGRRRSPPGGASGSGAGGHRLTAWGMARPAEGTSPIGGAVTRDSGGGAGAGSARAGSRGRSRAAAGSASRRRGGPAGVGTSAGRDGGGDGPAVSAAGAVGGTGRHGHRSRSGWCGAAGSGALRRTAMTSRAEGAGSASPSSPGYSTRPYGQARPWRRRRRRRAASSVTHSAVAGGEAADHGEAERAADRQARRPAAGRGGALASASCVLAHPDAPVGDGDDVAVAGVVADRAPRRSCSAASVGGVLHELGEQVGEVAGHVGGDGGLVEGQQVDPLVVLDLTDGHPHDVGHRDRRDPGAAADRRRPGRAATRRFAASGWRGGRA